MGKNLSDMTKQEVAEQMMEWFPWLKEPMPYQPRLLSKEQKEARLQFEANDEQIRWWIEQNRFDAMRRGE